jgi:hypothetical protein
MNVKDFIGSVASDKDYVREVQTGDYVIKSVYRPSELICLTEMRKSKKNYRFEAKAFQTQLSNYKQGIYIDFKIRGKDQKYIITEGVNDQADYAQRVGNLTYQFSKNCYFLVDNRDTVYALSYNFSNTYGSSPEININLVFPESKISKAKEKLDLVYYDQVFGINEKILLTYDPNKIFKSLPLIKE